MKASIILFFVLGFAASSSVRILQSANQTNSTQGNVTTTANQTNSTQGNVTTTNQTNSTQGNVTTTNKTNTSNTTPAPSNILLCGMNNTLRQQIIDTHNQWRQSVASGKVQNQPTASNMNVLSYSLELEGYSSTWASSCPTGHNPNRKDTQGNYFGENIYYAWSSQQIKQFDKSVAATASFAWYNEVQQFSNSSINPYQFSSVTGHYTQLMWANTYEVGCGIVLCKDSDPNFKSYPFKTIVVCNYRVAGNMIGAGSSMYNTSGAPASGCNSVVNNQYTALCGQPASGVTLDKGSCGPYTPK